MIINQEVTADRVGAIYNTVVNALVGAHATRAEALCGLLSVLGVQIKGQLLSVEELQTFTQEASTWMAAYLCAKEGVMH